MEKMDGKIRRDHIIEILKKEQDAISGSALAKLMGVSRQVIVQDITLLRTAYPILATARGYLLYPPQEKKCRRTFCVKHTAEQTRDELNRIVDLGGKVLDIMVEHDIYGQIRADLMLSRRKDVEEFCTQLEKSKSGPLNVIGSGVHYHTVEAQNEEILDEIGKALELYAI
jgi:transcriptional regulator of NAD metabolism